MQEGFGKYSMSGTIEAKHAALCIVNANNSYTVEKNSHLARVAQSFFSTDIEERLIEFARTMNPFWEVHES